MTVAIKHRNARNKTGTAMNTLDVLIANLAKTSDDFDLRHCTLGR